MVAKKEGVTQEVANVARVQRGMVTHCIIGETPLVPHAMSFKAQQILILPPPKKTAAEKQTTMKHEPFEEYRDATYQFRDEDDVPVRLYMPGSAFHSAMAQVAIDMAGAKKAQIGRLTSVPDEKVAIFGIPQIHTSIVKSSDMTRTPDIRTLPILPRWAAKVSISFVASLIKPESITNLLSNAGDIVGIGDGRPEKGKLTRGTFRVCNEDDEEYLEIVRSCTREAQDAALANPKYFDIETERLLTWFMAERDRRIATPIAPPKKRKDDVNAPQYGVGRNKGNGPRVET